MNLENGKQLLSITTGNNILTVEIEEKRAMTLFKDITKLIFSEDIPVKDTLLREGRQEVKIKNTSTKVEEPVSEETKYNKPSGSINRRPGLPKILHYVCPKCKIGSYAIADDNYNIDTDCLCGNHIVFEDITQYNQGHIDCDCGEYNFFFTDEAGENIRCKCKKHYYMLKTEDSDIAQGQLMYDENTKKGVSNK